MLERLGSKGNTSSLLVGVQTCLATLEIRMVVSQKIGNQSISRFRNTTLGDIPKDAHSYHKDICSTVFIVALFTITKT